MRIILLFIFSLIVGPLLCQTTAGFENLYPGEESFNLAPGVDGFFNSGNLQFQNDYNSEFMSFNGWAISSTTDNETPGFSNQSSAITGEGNNGSSTYAFAYAFDPIRVIPVNEAVGGTLDGFYVTNSTYAFLSMLNGDQFSKRFGGVSGDDPDFLLLTIEAYLNGELKEDKVEFYLADYRFEDNNEDYIVDDWTWVDLKPLGNVDSLEFSLSSSDNGDFGMNTPAYFCIDDFISLDKTTINNELADVQLNIFPNPALDKIQINSADPIYSVQVLDYSGRTVVKKRFQAALSCQLNVSNWGSGAYYLSVFTDKGQFARKIMRQ